MCGDLKYSLWSRHKYDPFSLLKSTHVWAPVERFSTLCRHSRCVGECFSIPKTSPGWYDVCLKSVALRICGQIFKKGFLIAHVREEGSTSRVNPQTKFDFSSLLLYIKSSDAFDDVVNQILDIDPHLSTLFEDIMNITSHGAAVGFGYRNGYRLPVWLSLLCSNPYHIYSKASNPSWCALLLCSKSPPTTYGFFSSVQIDNSTILCLFSPVESPSSILYGFCSIRTILTNVQNARNGASCGAAAERAATWHGAACSLIKH